MPIYEQTLTDLVEATDLPGDITLLSFAWATRDVDSPFQATPDAFYARTSEVAAIIAASPDAVVTSLADTATRYTALRRTSPVEGDVLPDIFTDVPWEITRDMRWRTEGGLPGLFIPASELGADIDPADLVHLDHSNNLITPFLADGPITRPMLVDGPSAEDFDLRAAAEILAAHPWIVSVHYHRPLYAGQDHNPATLDLVVRVPQDVFDAVFAATGYVSGHTLTEVLVWAGKYPEGTSAWMTLGPDPLGLAPAIRTDKYPHPSSEGGYWGGGEDFPDLEETYPSIRDTFHA